MKQYNIIILLFIVIIFSCKTGSYDRERQLPVRSIYPKEITKLMSSRQKKYLVNIAEQINQEHSVRLLMDVGSLKNGKFTDSYSAFRINYVRYSKYETANDRATLTSAYRQIRLTAKELKIDTPTVYWSPVASTNFAAFTTPLHLLNPKLKNGAIIEISNGIESNLNLLSNVLLNLAAHTYEKFENEKATYGMHFRTNDSINYIFKNRKIFQNAFNRNLLSYFFHEENKVPDTIFQENNNLLAIIAADDAINFICQHEYSHVILKHINLLEPVRFSMRDDPTKGANKIEVGTVNFKNELQADSLALVLSKNNNMGSSGAGIAIALIWLDITERVNGLKYKYNVYATHPPAKVRAAAILKEIKKKRSHDSPFDTLFYCYNLLWNDFELVLKAKIANANYNYN